MSIQKEIKDLQEMIKASENEIENLRHPEEKLRNAQEQYNNTLANRADLIISCYAEIAELSEKLNKPWYEYANSKTTFGHKRYKQNPDANNIARLYKNMNSMDYDKDYYYQILADRKNILDNFNGLRTEAENRLQTAKDNLAELEKFIQTKEEKKRPGKRNIPVTHTITIEQAKDTEVYLNPLDIKALALNGARGLTLVAGNRYLSVSKSNLKDIILDFPVYDVKVDNKGMSIEHQDTAFYLFYWQNRYIYTRKQKKIYEEAYLDISQYFTEVV